MSASSPVPKDHPLMVAWEAYKATEDYANTKRWAGRDDQATDGSLWASFERGWLAAGGRPPFDREPPAPPDDLVTKLRKRAQELALYAFREHGDDATLYNALADMGGVSPDGSGWLPTLDVGMTEVLAAPAQVAAPAPETPAPDAMPECPNCGGMGTTFHDILVGGTEHDTEERDCDVCKGTGRRPEVHS